MNIMRKVKIKKGDNYIEGYFHCWGLELDKGISSNYTVAIIEHEDGTVGTYFPNDIVFDLIITEY